MTDKDRKLLIAEEDVRARWREYFDDLLNRDDPLNPVEQYPSVKDVMSESSEEEVITALRSLIIIRLLAQTD